VALDKMKPDTQKHYKKLKIGGREAYKQPMWLSCRYSISEVKWDVTCSRNPELTVAMNYLCI
jgi:hypothetical protein